MDIEEAVPQHILDLFTFHEMKFLKEIFIKYASSKENETSQTNVLTHKTMLELLNEFDVPEMFTKLGYLFKKYEVSEKVHSEAELELRGAKECLERLELDSAQLQPLTQYSMI